MRITISGKNLNVTPGLSERLHKKLDKLDRYLDDSTEVQVRLSQERGARNIIEITILFQGNVLRAEESTNDMYQTVDKAVEKIEAQIHRHRTKLEKRLRSGALKDMPDMDTEVPEQEQRRIVRSKQFVIKPMEPEDAIVQMEMLDHNFFLFLNAHTDTMCVVYRRNNGNYGLIEPEQA